MIWYVVKPNANKTTHPWPNRDKNNGNKHHKTIAKINNKKCNNNFAQKTTTKGKNIQKKALHREYIYTLPKHQTKPIQTTPIPPNRLNNTLDHSSNIHEHRTKRKFVDVYEVEKIFCTNEISPPGWVVLTDWIGNFPQMGKNDMSLFHWLYLVEWPYEARNYDRVTYMWWK